MSAPKKKSDQASVVWGKAAESLRLGLSASDKGVRLHLENVGSKPMEVLSHVNAGEVHLDWYILYLEDDKGDTRTLRLLDDRDESALVRVPLAPGSEITHTVDVAAWAARLPNGSKPLAAGTYKVRAVYEVKREGSNWRGRLEAGPVTLTIAPKPG